MVTRKKKKKNRLEVLRVPYANDKQKMSNGIKRMIINSYRKIKTFSKKKIFHGDMLLIF